MSKRARVRITDKKSKRIAKTSKGKSELEDDSKSMSEEVKPKRITKSRSNVSERPVCQWLGDYKTTRNDYARKLFDYYKMRDDIFSNFNPGGIKASKIMKEVSEEIKKCIPEDYVTCNRKQSVSIKSRNEDNKDLLKEYKKAQKELDREFTMKGLNLGRKSDSIFKDSIYRIWKKENNVKGLTKMSKDQKAELDKDFKFYFDNLNRNEKIKLLNKTKNKKVNKVKEISQENNDQED